MQTIYVSRQALTSCNSINFWVNCSLA